MASFWLDDPDDDPFAPPPLLVGGLPSAAGGGSAASAAAGAPASAAGSGDSHQLDEWPAAASSAPASLRRSSAFAGAATFVCEQCGGRDCEWVEEHESERLVCTTCFTECSQPLSQYSAGQSGSQLEYEEVLGLAAKTRRGGIVTRKTTKAKPTARAATATTSTFLSADADAGAAPHSSPKRLPLEPLDNSVPFPDLLTCLEAFQTVLHGCTEILVPLLSSDEETAAADSAAAQRKMRKRRRIVHRTVRTLWETYLASWSEGAEKYGALHPAVRFSLRDGFAHAGMHRWMVMNAIAARHGTTSSLQLRPPGMAEPIASGGSGSRGGPGALPDRAPSLQKAAAQLSQEDGNRSSDGSDGRTDSELDDWSDSKSGSDSGRFTQRPLPRRPRRAIPGSEREHRQRHRREDTLVRRVLRHHRRHLPKTASDLALWTPPSMTMAAALLWLAVADAGVSPHRFCQWISHGILPLIDAHAALLTPEQRRAVSPVAYAFRLDVAPTPHMLLQRATQLAVACRMKRRCLGAGMVGWDQPDPAVEEEEDRGVLGRNGVRNSNRGVVFWSPMSLAGMLGQLVADLGLGQTVLDRSVRLSNRLHRRGHFPERLEAVVALVAVACFFEPDWREWSYERRAGTTSSPPNSHEKSSTSTAVPWNAEQLREMRNGSDCSEYTTFLERLVLHRGTIPPAVDFVETLAQQENLTSEDADADSDGDGAKAIATQPSVQPYRILCGGSRRAASGGSTGARGRQGDGRLDFTKILRARARSSRLETDPQVAALVEFLANAATVDASDLQSAIQKLLRVLQAEPKCDPSSTEKKSKTKRNDSTNEKSRYRRRIIK